VGMIGVQFDVFIMLSEGLVRLGSKLIKLNPRTWASRDNDNNPCSIFSSKGTPTPFFYMSKNVFISRRRNRRVGIRGKFKNLERIEVMLLKKNVIILDLIFYVGLPLLFWNVFRNVLGDYYAMLASSVPAIIYSLYRFYEVKKINITGLYIIITLVIGTLIDVLAGSALQLLWNNVFYNVAIGTFFLATILIKRPMAMYFGLDFAELQGHDRTFCKHLFKQKEVYIVFQLVTLLFAFRSGIFAAIKGWLIVEYGVEAFDKGILVRQVIGWVFTGLTIFGFIYTTKIIKDHPEITKRVEEELYGEGEGLRKES
jgi:hypothetical protein